MIAYVITIHKSQGATLVLTVMDISSKDRTTGQTYVAVSRVTSIKGIMFEKPFELRDLQVDSDSVGAWRLKDLERRRDADHMLN